MLDEEPGGTWNSEYSCRTAARLLDELARSNPRALANLVFPSVRTDMKTRREGGNLFYGKDGGVRRIAPTEWGKINKGLAMELLSASLFSCLDQPREVVSFCQLDEKTRLPKMCAGSDSADLRVVYDTYALVVEVSAQKRVSPPTYRRQLIQAINHSETLAKERPSRPVYALVINNGSIDNSNVYRRVYDELEPTAREKKGDIRLIPIWARDFAQIVSTLCGEDDPVGLAVPGGDIARALDTIHEHIATRKSPTKPGWTRAAFHAVLEGKPVPGVAEGPAGNLAERTAAARDQPDPAP